MKRLAFMLVSAFMAVSSYCASVTEKASEAVTGGDTQIEQSLSKQSLILDKAANLVNKVLAHYSHSSHYSHISHASHSSHYSHYSGR